MQNSSIITTWIFWHFYEAPKFLLQVWQNFINFGLNFFSVPLFLKTFFSPWKKYNWAYPKHFAVQKFFETLVSNIFSRLIGALLRLALIIAGILLQVFILLAGAIIFIGWLALPFLLIASFLYLFA